VEILSKLLPKEVESKIFHFEDFNFKCDWFPHNVNFKKNSTFDSTKEFVIIPEWMAVYHAKILQKTNVKYGIFVQNGFYLHTKPKNNFSDEEIKYILKSSPLHTQQLIIPKFEIKRLVNKFIKYDNKSLLNPELIIINLKDQFSRNLKLKNNFFYCSKKINETYLLYYNKENNVCS